MATINNIQGSHLETVVVEKSSVGDAVKKIVAEEERIKRTLDRPIETCTVKVKPKVDFSIEAILSSRTSTSTAIVVSSSDMFNAEMKTNSAKNPDDPQFSWVYCTRYRPPKLPRKSLELFRWQIDCNYMLPYSFKGVKREISLRNRYRNPRIPFSTSEVNALEKKFIQSPYLGSNDVNELAATLNMSPKRVSKRAFLTNWFFFSLSTWNLKENSINQRRKQRGQKHSRKKNKNPFERVSVTKRGLNGFQRQVWMKLKNAGGDVEL